MGTTQSPPSILLQGKGTMDTAGNGMLSAQHRKLEQESASPEIDKLCYSRLSEGTQLRPDGEAVRAPGPAAANDPMLVQGLAADLKVGSAQPDDLSDQSAAQEEQEDLLLSFEKEFNPSGSSGSAELLLA